MGRMLGRIGLAVGLAALGADVARVGAHEGNADPSQIHACVGKKGGKVRFLGADAALKCKKSESALHFGATGPQGAPGQPGAPGRSALTGLQAGDTITGVWGVSLPLGPSEEMQVYVQFPLPLSVALPDTKVEYVESVPTTNCPGPGQAAAGFLCVYQVDIANAFTPDSSTIFNPEITDGPPGAGRHGFGLGVQSTGGPTLLYGTYTATAP